jgi:hypothetical protein
MLSVVSIIMALIASNLCFSQDLEISFAEGYLGEKNIPHYSGPWKPVFHHEAYFGRMHWDDENFYSGHLLNYIWKDASDWSMYLSQEVVGASTCPHPVLSKNFSDIRYGYRLIAMSSLLELLDATRNDLALIKKPTSCQFDLQKILKNCSPKTADMKMFVNNLKGQAPFTEPMIGRSHNFSDYQRSFLTSIAKGQGSLGAIRASVQCRIENKNCSSISLEDSVKLLERSCEQDKALFQAICSETDHLYGMSRSPLATYLLATSNLVTLLNQEGMAQGCLRRFGQMMSGKEKQSYVLTKIQPNITAFLKKTWGDRFPHGRAFVYGALKEFAQKGLGQIFETKVIPEKPKVEEPKVVTKKTQVVETPVVVQKTVELPKPEAVKKPEVVLETKSAFLQASEIRASQDLNQVEVDMLKFQYDYVFSAAEMLLLEETLKDYTTRAALEEMRSWDKLGFKEAPMPLTFLKFLIDSQNHQGLYNVVGVLGEEFWVSNDIDKKPDPEWIILKNDASTSYSWALIIKRPRD